MATETAIQSDLAITPGAYLLEVLEEAGLSQTDLAHRTGRPIQAINEISKGNKAITPDTALQLETVLGVPAHIWTGLENDYRLVLAREREEQALDEDKPLAREFPFKQMADVGWVTHTRKPKERVWELRRFFGVSSLRHVQNVGTFAPAFRHAEGRSPSHAAVAAWLCGGEHDARAIETTTFDRRRLGENIGSIRELAATHEPNDALSKLRELLADCGVAFVLRPHLPKTYLTGATFWMRAQNKAVLMMSLRGSWADIFWFTLFHELCHVLKHSRRRTFVDFEGAATPDVAEQEAEADSFARDTLIAPQDWQAFVEAADFSSQSIFALAQRISAAPGIVTGRLQRERFIPYNRHDFRVRLKWAT